MLRAGCPGCGGQSTCVECIHLEDKMQSMEEVHQLLCHLRLTSDAYYDEDHVSLYCLFVKRP